MLNQNQLDSLTAIFQEGAKHASEALSRWIGRPTELIVQRVVLLALADAAAVLGIADEPINACVMGVAGRLTGRLMLAFDDRSGWALTELLTMRPLGSASEWSELERSAALETANIVGCSYLNSLSRYLSRSGPDADLLPSPPEYVRDYAYAILESAMLDQALHSNTVLLTETDFHLEGTPATWNLLFLPDDSSVHELQGLVS